MDNKLLGKRIKEARMDRGYTIEMLAESISLNKSTISRYERGEIESPKIPVIYSIANELHVNSSWLIGKSEDKSFSPPGDSTPINSPNNIFAPLRNMRKALRLSPDEVAYKVGISKEAYLAIENGGNTDCITLINIADVFYCSTDYVLSHYGIFGEDEMLDFLENKLLCMEKVFTSLSASNQELVLDYAKKLLDSTSD